MHFCDIVITGFINAGLSPIFCCSNKKRMCVGTGSGPASAATGRNAGGSDAFGSALGGRLGPSAASWTLPSARSAFPRLARAHPAGALAILFVCLEGTPMSVFDLSVDIRLGINAVKPFHSLSQPGTMILDC